MELDDERPAGLLAEPPWRLDERPELAVAAAADEDDDDEKEPAKCWRCE